MKKILAVIFAFAMTLSLAACGGGSNSSKTEAIKDLVVGVSSEPGNLDPQGIGMSTGLTLTGSFIYDPLLTFNGETNQAEPRIAQEWSWDDDTHLRIKIRDDVKSFQGTPITTADVQWCLERASSLKALGSYFGNFDAENDTIVSDYEMVIALKAADPIALNYLCLTNIGIMSKADYEAAGADAISANPTAATGPYKVEEWVTGDHMTLVRNDNYWGGTPAFETVTIKYIPDATTRLMALQSGDVMAIDRVPMSMASTVSSDSKLTLNQVKTYSTYMIPLDCTNEYLQDAKVRQALNMAIDRDALLNSIFFGFGETSTCTFPKGHALYTDPAAGEEWTYDVAGAKELLKEAGYENGFTINGLVMSTNQTYMDMLEFVQNAWSEIGVKLEIEKTDNATFFTKLNGGEWDVYAIASSGANYLSPVKHTDARREVAAQGYTQFNPSNPDEFLAAVDGLYTTSDAAKITEYATVYNHYIRTEVPTISLVNSDVIYATSSQLTGASLTPMADMDFSTLVQK